MIIIFLMLMIFLSSHLKNTLNTLYFICVIKYNS
uniref:Uncharacterized protein n=1 Tax=Chondria sp. (in: red algae) TaxID=1982705 RepID=A0A1Z1MC61_9FLOR|nr:hypothetical protein [Chondria sp. (in: red algae)]